MVLGQCHAARCRKQRVSQHFLRYLDKWTAKAGAAGARAALWAKTGTEPLLAAASDGLSWVMGLGAAAAAPMRRVARLAYHMRHRERGSARSSGLVRGLVRPVAERCVNCDLQAKHHDQPPEHSRAAARGAASTSGTHPPRRSHHRALVRNSVWRRCEQQCPVTACAR